MQDITYIIGHKNPDVDSICSALAYEKYKELIGEKGFCAARCGNSNTRIDRVLEKFNAHLPKFVGDVRLRTGDVMKTDIIKMYADASCFSVMGAIDKHDLRSIPIIDENNKLLGEVSVFDLGEFFIPHPKSAKEVRRVTATLNDIVKTLNATTHCIFEAEKPEDMYVRIGAMEVSTFDSFIHKEQLRPEQNLIVVGDRFDIQIKAVQMGVRAIIITGGYNIDDAVLEMARAKKVSVLSCPYDSATTALLVRMATRALPLMRKDLTILRGDYPLSKVSSKAKAFFGRTIYVCDENEKLQGLFSNTDLINLPKQKLVLVDHNELSQAVRGAEEADIIEIIDHHRLGSASTQSPILFLNKPVGSTCTIISSMFRRSGLKIDKQTAGLLCSGIVCDTLNLKSPTATSEDAEEIEALSKIIGITGAQLADYVFSGDSVILSNSADDVVLADCKIYNEGDVDFSVSQIEELDFSNFNSKLEELRTALERYRKAHNLYFSALFITNVLTQDSLLMICGADEFASRINYAKDSEREVFELPKIVSRKKQLIPYLSALLKD
jgi:manganese-dependent inorganic pyrophosphatase